MRKIGVAMAWLLLWGGVASSQESPLAERPPIGRGVFGVRDEATGRVLKVWSARPADFGAGGRVLFVFHGVKRNARSYRDAWLAADRSERTLVLAPEFSARDFPGSAGYALGGVVDAAGQPRARERWSFRLVEQVFRSVERGLGLELSGYDMFGHSAGAQFVHRFVLFCPEARLERAFAANAGWYTFSAGAARFPYGLADRPELARAAAKAYGRRLSVLLGERDSDPRAPYLRQSSQAVAQGAHRLARGLRFFGVAKADAAERGLELRWSLDRVPRVGHDFRAMARAAAALLARDAGGRR